MGIIIEYFVSSTHTHTARKLIGCEQRDWREAEADVDDGPLFVQIREMVHVCVWAIKTTGAAVIACIRPFLLFYDTITVLTSADYIILYINPLARHTRCIL